MGIPPGFGFDMGLAMGKAGLIEDSDGKKFYHVFPWIAVHTAGKVEDGLYCVTGYYEPEGEAPLAVTFDFGPELYPSFLETLKPDLRARVQHALSRQPYKFHFTREEDPGMIVVGHVGDKTYTNANESYRPFIAEEFHGDPTAGG